VALVLQGLTPVLCSPTAADQKQARLMHHQQFSMHQVFQAGTVMSSMLDATHPQTPHRRRAICG
jgi:hypothetical protein